MNTQTLSQKDNEHKDTKPSIQINTQTLRKTDNEHTHTKPNRQ